MRITPVNSVSNVCHPNFQGNRRYVYNKNGDFLYRTTTYFFRDDLNWNAFIKFISNKYKNADRVNILNHACSNGQEPYSLAAKLMQTLGEEAEKFFPIIAKDIDKENILMVVLTGLFMMNIPKLYTLHKTNPETDAFRNKEGEVVRADK